MKTAVRILVLILCVVTFPVATAEILSEEEKSVVITEYIRILDENAYKWTQFAEVMLSDHRVLSSPQYFSIDSSVVVEAMKVFDEGEKAISFDLSSSFDYILINQESCYVILVKELGIYHLEGIAQMYLLNMRFDLGAIHPENMKFVISFEEENGYYWSIFITHY